MLSAFITSNIFDVVLDVRRYACIEWRVSRRSHGKCLLIELNSETRQQLTRLNTTCVDRNRTQCFRGVAPSFSPTTVVRTYGSTSNRTEYLWMRKWLVWVSTKCGGTSNTRCMLKLLLYNARCNRMNHHSCTPCSRDHGKQMGLRNPRINWSAYEHHRYTVNYVIC